MSTESKWYSLVAEACNVEKRFRFIRSIVETIANGHATIGQKLEHSESKYSLR